MIRYEVEVYCDSCGGKCYSEVFLISVSDSPPAMPPRPKTLRDACKLTVLGNRGSPTRRELCVACFAALWGERAPFQISRF